MHQKKITSYVSIWTFFFRSGSYQITEDIDETKQIMNVTNSNEGM